ncbi:MAG: D-alanine--D-alanine ligase family protein [Polyangiales bacterium]
MRIALTHNLQTAGGTDESEAEFDTPETIEALSASMRRLGHEVEPVEVSGPVARTVSRLEAVKPDLVFNTAEGRRGRFREAFFPALFEELGVAFTGSDAHVCALTLDKQLSKLIAQQVGVPTPVWMLVEHPEDLEPSAFRFPVMVKPNFEGSSRGVTQESIVDKPQALPDRVKAMLAAFPSGLLVEEFIVGRDVTVPYLERAATPHEGVLEPAEYVFDESVTGPRRYAIYDYALKQQESDAVSVKLPADLDDEASSELRRLSLRMLRTLNVRDLGRVDWRVSPDGEPWFIEVNALPSLEQGAAIFEAARRAGLDTMDRVVETVLESAAWRWGLTSRKPAPRKKKAPLRVGLAYNVKRVQPEKGGAEDREAEYDAPATIDAVREAIASWGHEVVDLEATQTLASRLDDAEVDVVFNIAEGLRGRNREAQIPALLELLDIPYTGSDPATLSLALDKGLAKRVVRQAGIRTPDFMLMSSGKERMPKDFRFPVIMKPVAEGSSKGVLGASVFEDEASLRKAVRAMVDRYGQPALVETYLPGREFTVGLLGEKRPRALPPMEIVFTDGHAAHPVYTFDSKLETDDSVRYEVPAKVDDKLRRQIERVAKGVFVSLGCRDVARVDVRLDAEGKVSFIECNPLPGLTPGWSDLCLIAEAAGMEYRQLVREILAPAIRRLKEQNRTHRATAVRAAKTNDDRGPGA